MAIKINNAILHILKNDGSPSLFSQAELDIESEVCEAFINKHVRKLMHNPAAREATFLPDSVVHAALEAFQGGGHFKETALVFGHRLDDIINQYVDIPPADLLLVHFEDKKCRYFAAFKLNYKECFTHTAGADGADNQLKKCTTVLPFDGGKIEEACLIPLTGPTVVRLIEKAHPVDGQMVNYFSDIFLECETTISRKETVQIINEVSDEFIQEYFDGNPKTHAQLKVAINEEANDAEGMVSLENVASRCFGEAAEQKQQFVHTLREAGLVEDLPLGEKFVRQQFGTQRIKAENGIEVKFPVELATDDGQMEITNHPDGSVTVLLKRLRMA